MHTSPSEQLKLTVGKALGRVPSGLYILTAVHDARPWAMMASWVQQAAFAPPAVSVAVQKDRPMRDTLRAAGRFALAVVGEGDSALMKKYARGTPPGQDPFEGIETTTTPGGLPVPASALAYLDCRLIQVCEFNADHELHLAEVTAGQLLREGDPFIHVRGNGFHY